MKAGCEYTKKTSDRLRSIAARKLTNNIRTSRYLKKKKHLTGWHLQNSAGLSDVWQHILKVLRQEFFTVRHVLEFCEKRIVWRLHQKTKVCSKCRIILDHRKPVLFTSDIPCSAWRISSLFSIVWITIEAALGWRILRGNPTKLNIQKSALIVNNENGAIEYDVIHQPEVVIHAAAIFGKSISKTQYDWKFKNNQPISNHVIRNLNNLSLFVRHSFQDGDHWRIGFVFRNENVVFRGRFYLWRHRCPNEHKDSTWLVSLYFSISY